MQPDNVDIADKNVIGAIDRLVTNIALAGLAIWPTLFLIVIRPWKTLPLIKEDLPSGRVGMMLSPGSFFQRSSWR